MNTVDVLIFTDCGTKMFTRYAGAYAISTVLRKHGYTVQVVDHFLMSGIDIASAIIDKFVGRNTLFVGFATTFFNISDEHIKYNKFTFRNFINSGGGTNAIKSVDGIPISLDEIHHLVTRIKNINNKTQIVIGGTKADYLKQEYADAFILGNADAAVIEYCKFLEGDNPDFKYSTNTKTGQMIIDADTKAEGFDFQHSTIEYHPSDYIEYNEVLPIEIARGCIFRCKFCSYPLIGKKKNDHIKDSNTLYSEMMRNYERHGTTRYIFADDTHNESVEKLEYLHSAISKLPFKIEYAAYLRHDLIHRYPEMADLLMESGLKVASFGIETLNYDAGKLIGKGLHPEKTEQLLNWLRHDKKWYGNILMSSGFIIGLPMETKNTVNKWAENLLDFKFPLDSINFFPLFISNKKIRGSISEFERDYKKYGYWFDNKISNGWINEHWKVEDAITLANSLHKYARNIGRTKTYAFYSIMMQNFGYTWDDIYNNSWQQLIERTDTWKLNDDMAIRYFNNVLGH